MIRLAQFAACAAVLAALLAGVFAFERAGSRLASGLASAGGVFSDGGPPVRADKLVSARDAPRAPEFAEGTWIDSDPLRIADLRGRVVLVDFWTFACYNCRNTLPSLKRLHEAYAAKGLTIVGVHTPELERERAVENLRREINSLGITYAVVTDQDYATWRAYGVEAWPTIFILDKRGRVRYLHVGEGRYDEQERVVTTLLAEE